MQPGGHGIAHPSLIRIIGGKEPVPPGKGGQRRAARSIRSTEPVQRVNDHWNPSLTPLPAEARVWREATPNGPQPIEVPLDRWDVHWTVIPTVYQGILGGRWEDVDDEHGSH